MQVWYGTQSLLTDQPTYGDFPAAIVVPTLQAQQLEKLGPFCRRHVIGQPDRGDDAALALLNERYARGEITKETYEQMRTDLRA